MLIIFTPVRFLILLTVFELLPKTCNFTICSIFSNSSHVGWCTASPDTILKLDTLVMILTNFGFHWSSTFRGEDFWKSLRRTTDDGRQVMAIAHMTLRVRWAKNQPIRNKSRLWRSCLLTDRDEMSNLYRGPSIDASYQVSVHLAKRFQRRTFFKNWPIRNQNCLWQPCSLMDLHKMSKLYRGPSIDASYQVSVHLA